jgi:hypothetical protein
MGFSEGLRGAGKLGVGATTFPDDPTAQSQAGFAVRTESAYMFPGFVPVPVLGSPAKLSITTNIHVEGFTSVIVIGSQTNPPIGAGGILNGCALTSHISKLASRFKVMRNCGSRVLSRILRSKPPESLFQKNSWNHPSGLYPRTVARSHKYTIVSCSTIRRG